MHRQKCTLTFTPMGNLESPIKLACMFLDCGWKPRAEENQSSTGRTCKLHTERPQQAGGFEPGTFYL
ncbi:hypothetical protein EXN66_Car021389 [Channa argus]|uniref:Uncharacterized protein n=1 Tax=Channa argus TaxID=215402 RepID=A0A6G1QU05_CHAAH|nr:hypothetical protein EXN66_Car021389 [Channa argus]